MIWIKSAPVFVLLPIFLMMLLTTCIYIPSMSGSFFFDDVPNIVKNAELQFDQPTLANFWRASWSSDSGPLNRPVAMFSFALNIVYSGLNPFPMKITNLIIHWLTGINLFFISYFLIKQLRIPVQNRTIIFVLSAVTMIIWAVHPINVTAVAYIVQRMTSLSGFFTSLAILIYVYARTLQQIKKGHWSIVFLLLTIVAILGLLSKENAVLLPVYLFIIEYYIFCFKSAYLKDKKIIIFFFVIVLALPSILFFSLMIFNSGFILEGYRFRDFSLSERLLTEARIVVWYIRMILLPDIAQMSMYHDDIIISSSLFKPLTTLFSILTIVLLFLGSIFSRKYFPFFGFGVLWFFGGHLLESTIIDLELAFEHRNYLPCYGLILAIVVTIFYLISSINMQISSKSLYGLIVIFIGALCFNTYLEAKQWSGTFESALIDAAYQPQSTRANINAGTAYSNLARYFENPEQKKILIEEGKKYFNKAIQLSPDTANPVLGVVFMYYDNKLDPPKEIFDEIIQKLKTGMIDASTAGTLDGLTHCKLDGLCTLDDDKYLEIIDAAFRNPNIPDAYASNLLRGLSTFYVKTFHDNEIAILLTKRAIELRPKHIDIRLELIHYLANAGYFDLAKKELEILKNMDMYNKYFMIINDLEVFLDKIISTSRL